MALYIALIAPLLGFGVSVSTFEETLDAGKGKVVLFAELKGKTADEKMADYAVKSIRDRGVEEESATENTISAAHNQNKKLLVWTSNEKGSQKHFLCSNADGMITDNVTQAVELRERLKNRTDLQRMIDRIMTIVS